jgi:hypothetical protein
VGNTASGCESGCFLRPVMVCEVEGKWQGGSVDAGCANAKALWHRGSNQSVEVRTFSTAARWLLEVYCRCCVACLKPRRHCWVSECASGGRTAGGHQDHHQRCHHWLTRCCHRNAGCANAKARWHPWQCCGTEVCTFSTAAHWSLRLLSMLCGLPSASQTLLGVRMRGCATSRHGFAAATPWKGSLVAVFVGAIAAGGLSVACAAGVGIGWKQPTQPHTCQCHLGRRVYWQRLWR